MIIFKCCQSACSKLAIDIIMAYNNIAIVCSYSLPNNTLLLNIIHGMNNKYLLLFIAHMTDRLVFVHIHNSYIYSMIKWMSA